MKKKKVIGPSWFLVFETESYLSVDGLSAYTRRDLVERAERDFEESWEEIRKEGGRAVKGKIVLEYVIQR